MRVEEIKNLEFDELIIRFITDGDRRQADYGVYIYIMSAKQIPGCEYCEFKEERVLSERIDEHLPKSS